MRTIWNEVTFEIYRGPAQAFFSLLLGYLEFVALLFLPGVAFIELFRLGAEYSFAERLGTWELFCRNLSLAMALEWFAAVPIGANNAGPGWMHG